MNPFITGNLKIIRLLIEKNVKKYITIQYFKELQ